MAGLVRFRGRAVALAALAAVLTGFALQVSAAADRRPLDAEARELAAAPFVHRAGEPVVVVTGSSTVRLWPDCAKAFPEAQVVNTGFGGSTMDLLAMHYDGLIGRYRPDQVFIGSGDNDLAEGRSPERVIFETRLLLDRIHSELPDTQVAIIAAKPSIKRWYLRDRYQELNSGFEALAAARPNVVFVDVWNRLLDARGRVRPELYAADGLHLNAGGYRIYAAELAAAEALPRNGLGS